MNIIQNEDSLKSLLLFVHSNLMEFLSIESYSDYTDQEKDKSQYLRGTIQILINFACETKEEAIYTVVNDFEYAINHLGLANFKAESALNDAKENIEKL